MKTEHRFAEWGGLTGLQCLYCGAFHIDRAYTDRGYESKVWQDARAAFKQRHTTCVKPTKRRAGRPSSAGEGETG